MEYPLSSIAVAFGLTLAAGLATGLGGILAIMRKNITRSFFSAAMGFSAGVMIYISFVELLAGSISSLEASTGNAWLAIVSFFAGIFLAALIDKFVPCEENPHELHGLSAVAGSQTNACDINPTVVNDCDCEDSCSHRSKGAIMRTGLMAAIAIAVHNFPEGIASFISALHDPALGITIAVAIAIHNIPEGVSIAVPIKFATDDSRKAVGYAFLTGLAEPLGAIVAFLVIMPFVNDILMAIIFAVVAGIMIYISFDELLPAAQKNGKHHAAIWGLIAGMAVIGISLELM